MTQKENVVDIVNHWQSSVTESAEITPEQWASLDSVIADQVAAKTYPLAGVSLAESLAEVAEQWQSPTTAEILVGKLETWPRLTKHQNHLMRKLRNKLSKFRGRCANIGVNYAGDSTKKTRIKQATDEFLLEVLKLFADSTK